MLCVYCEVCIYVGVMKELVVWVKVEMFEIFLVVEYYV